MNTNIKNKILFPLNILYRVNPELVLKILFRTKVGYKLDLDNPKTYNEKIQWMKLYYKNPLMTTLSDKYLVRDWIKEKIGEEYVSGFAKKFSAAENKKKEKSTPD